MNPETELVKSKLNAAIDSLDQIKADTIFDNAALGIVCAAINDALVDLLDGIYGVADATRIDAHARAVSLSLRHFGRVVSHKNQCTYRSKTNRV